MGLEHPARRPIVGFFHMIPSTIPPYEGIEFQGCCEKLASWSDAFQITIKDT
jgi:hypothetical protein